VCPGAPAWCLVVVSHWADAKAEDDWDDLPQVTPHHPENWGGLAPAAAITAFGPWGATQGMTLREVLRIVRQHWPTCRP